MTTGRTLGRGDVVLASFPFTDQSALKVRPALIVARPLGDDFIIAFATSRIASGDPQAEYLLEPADPEFPATGLKGPALIRLNKLATLHRSLVRRRPGRTGPKTQQLIDDCRKYVFDL